MTFFLLFDWQEKKSLKVFKTDTKKRNNKKKHDKSIEEKPIQWKEAKQN